MWAPGALMAGCLPAITLQGALYTDVDTFVFIFTRICHKRHIPRGLDLESRLHS